jgi:predicted nucleotide-binding protein
MADNLSLIVSNTTKVLTIQIRSLEHRMPKEQSKDEAGKSRLIGPREQAREQIRLQIYKGRDLISGPISSSATLVEKRLEQQRWNAYNIELLGRLFDSSYFVEDYKSRQSITLVRTNPTFEQMLEYFIETVQEKINKLVSIEERLQLIPEPSNTAIEPNSSQEPDPKSRRVFVVHGHNQEVKETVARTLSVLHLEPIILGEEANNGRTIIEKFEQSSDVAFAVVVLTADDLGAPRAAPGALKSRARQNVILELGYFIARLGRKRVCTLYEEGVEIPSDILGVGYVPIDPSGAWKFRIASEIKGAGIEVDLNLVKL